MNTTNQKNGWIIVAMSAVAVCTLLLPATRAMSAQVLSSDGASIENATGTGTFTTSSTFSNVTGLSADLTLASAGQVMVISTFSTNASAGGTVGEWRVSDGTAASASISRYMGNSQDYGIGMAVNIFSSEAGARTYSLQHASANNSKIQGGAAYVFVSSGSALDKHGARCPAGWVFGELIGIK